MRRARTRSIRRIARRRGLAGPTRPTAGDPGPIVCARQEQDSKARTAARRRPNRRVRFSAATRNVPRERSYGVEGHLLMHAADRGDHPRMTVSARPEDTRDQGLYSGKAGIGCFG